MNGSCRVFCFGVSLLEVRAGRAEQIERHQNEDGNYQALTPGKQSKTVRARLGQLATVGFEACRRN